MSYKAKFKIVESLEILRKRYTSTKDSRIKLKIKGLILLKENPDKKQEEIASHLCIGYSTLKRWIKQYNNKGFDAFSTIKAGGQKKSIIPEAVHKGLEEKLNDSANPLLGYWDAALWVENNFHVRIKYQTLRKYMIKHFKCKLKAPRKSHYQKDEQAIEAFLKTP